MVVRVQAVKEWIRGVAILMVFAGAVDMALPEGDLRKYARTAMGMLIVLSVVAPFAGIITGGTAFRGVFLTAPASSTDLDRKTASALEWQAETLARAIPGVRWARARVDMKDSSGWALPRRDGVVEGVRLTISAETGGDVEAAATSVPADSRRGRELAAAVRAVVSAGFGVAAERVVVEVVIP